MDFSEPVWRNFHRLSVISQNTDEMNIQLINYLDSNSDGQIDSLEWTIRLNETLSFEFEVENFRTDVRVYIY